MTVLLAKEEPVLRGMIDKLTEIGSCYGMEMNVDKTKVMRISRQSSPLLITCVNNCRISDDSTLCVAS